MKQYNQQQGMASTGTQVICYADGGCYGNGTEQAKMYGSYQIGGDPIIGTTTREAVELLMNDPETEGIVMIGEIGGNLEAIAARWIKENANKQTSSEPAQGVG